MSLFHLIYSSTVSSSIANANNSQFQSIHRLAPLHSTLFTNAILFKAQPVVSSLTHYSLTSSLPFIPGRCGQGSPCEQLCYELHDGMYECDCTEGFELNKNGYSCQGKLYVFTKRHSFVLLPSSTFISFPTLGSSSTYIQPYIPKAKEWRTPTTDDAERHSLFWQLADRRRNSSWG